MMHLSLRFVSMSTRFWIYAVVSMEDRKLIFPVGRSHCHLIQSFEQWQKRTHQPAGGSSSRQLTLSGPQVLFLTVLP